MIQHLLKKHKRNKKALEGFTLIEVLVVVSLFLVAITAFGYVLKTGKTALVSSLQLSQAVYSLQSKMEETRSLSFNQLPSLHGTTFAEEKGEVLITSLLPDLAEVQLELEWAPNKEKIKFYTLRSEY